MCYSGSVTAEPVPEADIVGLRELRQHASDLVRRVGAGETIVVTVSGRPAARMVPVERRSWLRWDDVRTVFSADRAAEGWEIDRDLLDAAVTDPWLRG